MLPLRPFKVTLCMKGTSGNGLISNSSGSSDPTVYRSRTCILVDGIYIGAPGVFGVHTAESRSMSPSGVILRNGFVLSCDFMYLVYVICLGRLFIGDWRRRHVGSKSYKEGGCEEKERG